MNTGLYRNDCLIVTHDLNGHKLDKLKKNLITFSQRTGLQITININLTSVDFLDNNLDLQLNKFKPHLKPNEKLCYISKESNHLAVTLTTLVNNVRTWIPSISSDEVAFQNAAPYYNSALRRRGFSEKIQLNQVNSTNNRTRKTNSSKVL